MSVREIVPYKIKKGDILFFLHLPKTAGTTVYEYLRKRFEPGQIMIFHDKDLGSRLSTTFPDDFIQYKLFRQHEQYHFFRYLPRKPVYLTVLRNPITRVYSLYKHILRTPHHPLHAQVAGMRMGIKDFVESEVTREVSDFQVLYLSGHMIGKVGGGKEAMLEIAKMRLHEFAYFGLQERMDESMELLRLTFGWGERKYQSHNIAPEPTKTTALSDPDLEAIRRRNEFDLRLYEYAVNLFDEKIIALKQDGQR